MTTFGYTAPPFVYGPWQDIGSYLGSVHYTIEYSPIGDAIAMANVKYFTDNGQVEQEFVDQITIETGNVGGNVWIQFKTMGPTGVSIEGTINP